MPASSTFTPIATQTSNGSAQALIFTSIPQTYTDLFIAVALRSTNGSASDSWQVQVNATSSIYSDLFTRGDGASVSTGRNTSTFGCVMGNCPANSATANMFNAAHVYINNYTSTAMFKSVSSVSGTDRNGSGTVEFVVGNIRTASAVTRVDVFTTSANMATGSTVTLYGVTRA
jgi:hypothetical protein